MTKRFLILLALAMVPAMAAPVAAQTSEVCTQESVGTGPDAWIVWRCYPINRPLSLPRRLRR